MRASDLILIILFGAILYLVLNPESELSVKLRKLYQEQFGVKATLPKPQKPVYRPSPLVENIPTNYISPFSPTTTSILAGTYNPLPNPLGVT